jgi:glyoxylase-like metal-dependent hydrolase (beta-lactamase superfamily II)/rhodanese-related sulfurtransferase
MTDDVVPSTVEAVTFEASGLGDRSYLIHDHEVAVVVDPQRDPTQYVEAANELSVRITHVFETHIHNDYVSGGFGLSREIGASYLLPEGEQLEFDDCQTLGDGFEVVTGRLKISALATPGHTPHHLSYLIRHDDSAGGFVCTGGSVLPGGVGRTDLLGKALAPELARAQWSSARRVLDSLDVETTLLPTHGFGSFCSATPNVVGTAEALTIAVERSRNPAMKLALEEFVHALVADPPPIPSYYAHMAPINRSGRAVPHFGDMARLDAIDLERLVRARRVVSDLRNRRSFADRHHPGTLNIELGTNLTTYFGWVVPFEAPYTLIANSIEEVEQTRRLLARIGREHVFGYVLAEDVKSQATASYPVATFAELALADRLDDEPFVLDVRHPSEWRAGHLLGAKHVPLAELESVRSSLPVDRAIWVHCAAGYRAAIAASQLSSWSFSPVLVDDQFENASAAGLDVTSGPGD